MLGDVLVVGAGPVGLTVAVELWLRGVPCRVVDRLLQAAPYAKAVGIQPRTLEMWERQGLGLLRDVLDQAVAMRGQLVFVNGAQVSRLDIVVPSDVPFGFVALPQNVTEHLLAERLGWLGGRVERGVELVGFDQDADGVTVRLAGPDGEQTTRVAYLVGADGAHSRVRAGLGLAFTGEAFSEEYMLGDVEVDWSLPQGYAVRSMHQTEGRTDDALVCIPLPGVGRYRMSMLAPDDLATKVNGDVQHGIEDGKAPDLEHIQAVLDRLAPEPTKAHHLRWSSLFRISRRLVDRYGVGRVFVAGDAAHIHPPTGAQGMNTGIQDGINLAWKLALAVQGAAADGLLASYHAERHPVGEEVVGRTTRHARQGIENDPADPTVVIRREAQLLVNYRDSAMVGGTADSGYGQGPHPGDRAPDCRGLRRAQVNIPLRLFELLADPHHTLLLYTDETRPTPDLAEIDGALTTLTGGRARTYLITPDPGLSVAGAPVLVDAAHEFRDTYGAAGGSGYLVRPDGYLGFRAAPLTLTALRCHLELMFAAPTPRRDRPGLVTL
jgi:2-polyprenyl-6-methoxyphenol hydroxylase-like FAD-dependent oxidoreductase